MDAVYDVYDYLGTPDGAALVWGVVLRLIACVCVCTCVSLHLQIRGLAGEHGISPARALLSSIWRDFGVSSLWRWPTLLWLSLPFPAYVTHALTQSLTLLGIAAGLVALLANGPITSAAFLVVYLVLLSIDVGAHTLAYPWDSLLFEAVWLCVWMPCHTHTLTHTHAGGLAAWTPSLRLSSPPPPLLAFAVRWSIVRLLVGFGKLKFLGSTRRDSAYIHTFMHTQPIPAPPGAVMAARLPKFVWPMLVMGMFVVEIPMPLAALLAPASWGWVRVAVCVSVCGLMAGIQVAGNFGFFNVLTAIMVLPFLAHNATIFSQETLDTLANTPSNAAFSALFLLHMLPASLVAFVMNSWMNNGWAHWPAWALQKPAWLFSYYVAYLRAWAPFRIVQAFGVFPPNAFPGQRWVARYEVAIADPSATGDSKPKWLPLPTPYYDQAMVHVAPHHPRLDHAIFYESLGLSGYNLANILGHHSPYKLGYENAEWVRLQLRLANAFALPAVRSSTDVLTLLNSNEDATARAAALQQAVGSKLMVLDAPYWAPRDTTTAKHSSFRGWQYVQPLVQCRISLMHQLPTPIGSKAFLDEVRVGLHMPTLATWHLFRHGSQYAIAPDETAQALQQGTVCGPEEFFWDFTYWRHIAGTTAGRITEAEYDAAWKFIAAVRSAAAEAAEARSRSQRQSFGPDIIASTESVIAVQDVNARTRLHVPTPAATFAKAASAMPKNDPSAQTAVPVHVANVVFSLSTLAEALRIIRTRMSPLELLAVRRTIHRMAVPLQRALERVFWRVPPTTAEASAELDKVPRDAEWDDWYKLIGDMINGDPKLSTGVPPSSDASAAQAPPQTAETATISGEEFAVVRYADNDDAQVTGCMRNALRIGMYTFWTLLVRGRTSYEAAVGGAAQVLGRQLPTGFSGPGASDDVATSPVATVCKKIIPDLTWGPHRMGTDAGLFLHAIFHYDLYAQMARHSAARTPGMPLRPSPTAPPTNLRVVPGVLEITDRLGLHGSLRIWDHMAHDFVPDVSAPQWGFAKDGEWICVKRPTPVSD